RAAGVRGHPRLTPFHELETVREHTCNDRSVGSAAEGARMSALADAIRRGRPRLDLTRESPFAGLHRRHASVVDVVAQSVTATAQAAVMLMHPDAPFGRSSSLAFTELVLTVGLVVAVALVIGMLSRRISSTGSLYTYTTRGLGPWA